MPKKTIIKPARSPAAIGPYNHAVRVGELLFCAGQIPLDPASGNLVSGDIKAQTERVLENIKAILDDQKLEFTNVIKTTVFLTNLADFAAMNKVWDAWVDPKATPARATVEAKLARPEYKIEIVVTAAV